MVVRNAGVDWDSPDNCYWQHKVARKEAARIVLHGQSEFEASHVVLEGDQTFEVCDASCACALTCQVLSAMLLDRSRSVQPVSLVKMGPSWCRRL